MYENILVMQFFSISFIFIYCDTKENYYQFSTNLKLLQLCNSTENLEKCLHSKYQTKVFYLYVSK